MRLVIQRVSSASVDVEGRRISEIDTGLVVLVGIGQDDTEQEVKATAQKVVKLRIFPDGEGKMNLSVADIDGQVLVVSQFTLFGDTSRGNRPSFVSAAAPGAAEPLVGVFAEEIRSSGIATSEGIFGKAMEVALVNQGPVTIII